MSSEDDSDEVYDEIDRFHMSRDEIEEEQDVRFHKQQEEEVLNVEGEASENEDDDDYGDDDDGDESAFDSDSDDGKQNVEKLLPSADKWGRGKRSFYSTSYVDGDWGGMNDDEIELAELEEEDATMRQKKLDDTLNHARLSLQDPEEEKTLETDVPDISKMTEDEKFAFFNNKNPEVERMLIEYNEKKDIFVNKLVPLLAIAEKLRAEKQGTVLEKQLRLVVGVFSRYLMNIMFFIHLKVSCGLDDGVNKALIDNHPVLDSIIALKKKMAIVEDFLVNNASVLEKLRVAETVNVEDLEVITTGAETKSKNISKKAKNVDAISEQIANIDEEMEDEGLDDEHEGAEKRFITAEIEKNKGLATKRKKGTQHSRVKKRKQFKKALIKRRSQKPDVKRELTPYGGESRGIRVSAVKSIKLKA